MKKRINWWNVWFCTLSALVAGVLTIIAFMVAMSEPIIR